MPGRILIIDPDEDQLTELRLILEEQGCSVETACDGLEGLQKGKLFQPDLVITELLLNRLSGFEVSVRIAADAGFQAPVIFYTGFYRDEYARKEVTSKYGAIDYFIKPFQREGLKKAVAAILSQKEATKPVVLQRPESTALAEEKIQSLEPHEENEVRDTREPPHDSESWLGEMETAQQNSPLSGMDEATKQAEKNQETIIATLATVSPKEGPHQSEPEEKTAARRFAQPVSPEPEVGPTANQVVPALSNELSTLSAARKPPTAFFIYKSRPAQAIAIMTVLFLVFLGLKGRIPYFEKKDDYRTLAVQKESMVVQPPPQVGSPPTPTSGAPSRGESQEPVKENPASAPMLSSAPADKSLGANAIVDTSSSVSSHPGEKRSTRRSLPREIRNPRGRPANWVINDVTGARKSPFLRKSRRPVLPLEMIQAPSAKPVVIRIVISQEGKVLEATPINEDESNVSLSQAAQAVVQDWEFEPIRKSDEKTWTKYFSFRLTRESD
jgi:DNA-binding response OmpR family regulator